MSDRTTAINLYISRDSEREIGACGCYWISKFEPQPIEDVLGWNGGYGFSVTPDSMHRILPEDDWLAPGEYGVPATIVFNLKEGMRLLEIIQYSGAASKIKQALKRACNKLEWLAKYNDSIGDLDYLREALELLANVEA